ncbi:MAG: macro domain-containing protein, partial [Parahaliea sp.]
AAGPALLAACRAVPEHNGIRCPAGQARITAAGKLDARFVIHTVGPRYGIDPGHRSLLTSAYRNTFQLALENDCHSLAVPAISCGVYGYPLKEAAQVALGVCAEAAFSELNITFYLFGDEIFAVWDEVLEHLQDDA